MTRKFPVAVWQDSAGSFTASVLDGTRAVAYDATAADALAQLKKFLTWTAKNGEGVSDSDFVNLTLRDLRVRLRPEYRTADSIYPVSTSFQLRVTCALGERQDGSRHCVIPTLGIRFSYQPQDPLEELVAELVQAELGNKTPQQLSRELMPPRLVLDAVHIKGREVSSRSAETQSPTLETVADPLGRRTRGPRLARAIGRDADVRQLAERLTGPANLLLLGEGGVGKSTLLGEAIRQVVRRPREAGAEFHRVFWRTSGQRLIAGMQYLGQWEERCEKVIEELAETGGILCIDDLLELVRVGSGEPGASVAAFLMPFLQRGELRFVAEASVSQLDACRRLLPGLAELFQIVRVSDFSPAEARNLLTEIFAEHRRNHHLVLDDGLADLVYRLFRRFQPYAAFPGKCASFVRRLLNETVHSGGRELTQHDVLDRFRSETGLPEVLLRDDLPLPHAQVLADLNAAVLGQRVACQAAAGVVTARKTGLNDPRRPLGVLLFCGPTGVGKTELAKALARYLFGAGAAADRLVRLDMSEYAGYGAAQRLVLSATGEVSDFIQRVRRQPFVVILLDEIEKAASEVHDMLLSVLDEGRLTDRFGRTTTFHSAVIVMTSNLGAARTAAVGYGEAQQPSFERIAMTEFRPEFYNRLDRVVAFEPLAPATIAALARRELGGLAAREGLTKANIHLTWSDAVVELLVSAGYDDRYGARPLLRAVERLIVAPLSRWLLANPGVCDMTLQLDVTEDSEVKVLD